MKWLRSPWIISVAFVLIALFIVAGYWFQWRWTGFPAKTLWDWFNLLGVLAIPVVVGLGAAWYTAQQGKVSDRENTDNQHEAALQAYIDKMSELLLEKKLRQSAEGDEVRNIARVRTLTVLPRLDPIRKASVLQFLTESGLLDNKARVIDLSGADLSHAALSHTIFYRQIWEEGTEEPDAIGVDLSGVNLHEANLWGTNLAIACLNGANLSYANLSYAFLDEDNFFRADLSYANLSHAIIPHSDRKNATTEQLKGVKSFKGAIMPDGSKHP